MTSMRGLPDPSWSNHFTPNGHTASPFGLRLSEMAVVSKPRTIYLHISSREANMALRLSLSLFPLLLFLTIQSSFDRTAEQQQQQHHISMRMNDAVTTLTETESQQPSSPPIPAETKAATSGPPAAIEVPSRENVQDGDISGSSSPRHSIRFYLVFTSLCLISFVSALDATIIGTALPTITRDIGGESQYAWIANCFIITSTAPQPLFAQISNIFGRRNPMLVALGIFGLGSGIAGGAGNVAMLIAGRSIQGIGQFEISSRSFETHQPCGCRVAKHIIF